MADYYQILGLNRSADAAQIKAAYKKLAMRYHPDRNAGDKSAEEIFKLINEAYHTLSDPLKKSRYDLRFGSFDFAPSENDRKTAQRRRYAPRPHPYQTQYKVDKEYFKIQGLAVLVFIVIAGLCFATVHSVFYFFDQRNQTQWRTNSQSLKQVHALFGSGNYDSAFTLIHKLKQTDPLEYRFNFTHDSLTQILRDAADDEFNHHNFSLAITNYLLLKKYEDPVSFETIQRIAMCQFYLGNFDESLQAMKQLHNQQPDNLELIYAIAVTNLERLDDPEAALSYLNQGKKLFEENLTKVYGEGFMLVMNPADAPDIYFYIFEARASTNLKLKNYREAIADCRWAIFLRPNLGEPYKLRAQANIESHLFENVCPDLRKAKELNTEDVNVLIERYCH